MLQRILILYALGRKKKIVIWKPFQCTWEKIKTLIQSALIRPIIMHFKEQIPDIFVGFLFLQKMLSTVSCVFFGTWSWLVNFGLLFEMYYWKIINMKNGKFWQISCQCSLNPLNMEWNSLIGNDWGEFIIFRYYSMFKNNR